MMHLQLDEMAHYSVINMLQLQVVFHNTFDKACGYDMIDEIIQTTNLKTMC